MQKLKLQVPVAVYAGLLILFLASCKGNDEHKIEKNKTINMTDSVFFKHGYSDVNGIRMYYEIHGNHPAVLVLIHGGGSTINTSFARLLPMLAKDLTVVAVELQGHGHTGDRNVPSSFEQDADDVAALLSNLHISKASFLGFSNGGNTAIQIANRHPQMVDKLIIASSFYKREGFPPGFFDGMKQATINDMPQVLKDAFIAINPDSNALLNMFNKDRNRMLEFVDWKDETLSAIKTPVLIMNGDKDVISNEHALAMTKLIPNGRLAILPATHGAYLGAAESEDAGPGSIAMTAGIIKNFLNKQ